jgi:hypothetical protein
MTRGYFKMDIHFQPVPAEDARTNKIFTFGFVSALKVQGLQALVNRWIKTFMTPLGSDPLHRDRGTSFSSLVGVNLSLNNPDVEDSVVLAIDATNEQIEAQDEEGDYPESEMLGYAKLTALSYDALTSALSIWVDMSNKNGDYLTVKLAELADR